jgi:hypothetical protein
MAGIIAAPDLTAALTKHFPKRLRGCSKLMHTQTHLSMRPGRIMAWPEYRCGYSGQIRSRPFTIAIETAEFQ